MPFTIGNYVRKNLSTPQGFLRAAALLLATATVAGGVILGYGVSRPNPAALSSLNDENIVLNFTAKENVQGCVGSGTSTGTGCVQIISGVTQNHFIFTKSGGLIVGSFANPQVAISGSLVKIGGGYPDSTAKLEVVGTTSGSTIRANSELTSSGTLAIEGDSVLGGTLTVNQSNAIWSVVAGANAACNATCTSACVFGVNTAATEADIVACTDTTADECLCAGAN